MDNTVRVQVSVAAPTSPQGGLRNSSPSFRGAVCIYTLRLLYASRKCKTFVRSSFFALPQNCRSLTHFHSAGAARAAVLQGESRNSSPSFRGAVRIYTLRLLYASRKCKTFVRSSFFALLQNCRPLTHFHSAGAARAAVLQGGLRNSSPSFGELFAYTPCGSFARRENARRSFAPRFSLRCKTVAPSPLVRRSPATRSIRVFGRGRAKGKKKSGASAPLFCVLLF